MSSLNQTEPNVLVIGGGNDFLTGPYGEDEFFDDLWPKRYAIWDRLVAEQPGQIAYSIIDAKSIDMFMPSVFPPVVAGSIRELATKLTMDPSTLEKTVNRFSKLRKYLHHAVFYGFLFCLASTTVAAFYDHLLHLAAPYPLLSCQ